MVRIQDTVGYVLAQVCKVHRQQVDVALKQLGREHCGGDGLHVGQEMILLQLWGNEGLTQTQLAERLGVEPPTVTRMLQRMEASHLLVRNADSEDGRISRVYLTDRGRALEEPIARSWAGVEERLTAAMTAEERLLLRRLLQQVHINLAD